jgi:hypothetical protein
LSHIYVVAGGCERMSEGAHETSLN